MPPFVPLADGAQVEIVYDLLGKIVENRLWFVCRTPPIGQLSIDALADGVYAWHVSSVLPFLSSDIQLAAVEAKDWTADPFPFLGVAGPPINGGSPTRTHSANVSVRVRFKGSTAETWRQNSNFIPGVPLDAVDGNVYTLSFRNAMFDAYVALIDLAPTWGGFPGWRWVTASRQVDNGWRSDQAFARIDFIQFPSPYVSPRRRRLPRMV